MKLAILIGLLTILRLSSYAQINKTDSTVKVITYWDKGEKQYYTVKTKITKIKNRDTTSNETSSYDVEITVLDEDKESYTIEWKYKNVKSNTTNPVYQKVLNITNQVRIVIKTNELGEVLEVVNWKEIRELNKKSISALRKEFKEMPAVTNFFDAMESQIETKESIERSIKDIIQFHTFHGAKYKLGEVLKGNLKVLNAYGGDDFDAECTVRLTEINDKKNQYVLKSTQRVNKEQLISATLQQLEKMARSLNV